VKSVFQNKYVIIIAGVGILLGCVGFIMRVTKKVSEGKGLEYYRSFAGIEWNYLAVFILLAIIPLVVVIALIWRW
jgi:hypothetical protein